MLDPCYKTIVEANRDFYAEISSSYDFIARSQPYFKRYLENLLRNIKFNENKKINILDIGTGTGFALEVSKTVLRDKQLALFGCDISNEMLLLAKRKVPEAEFVVFDGMRLPRYDMQFDMIILCSVLHHIFNPYVILEQTTRLLTEKGTLVILEEPNPLINEKICMFRKTFNLLPDSRIQLAEYHQFITSGLASNTISEILKKKDFEVSVLYTNVNFADELARRYHLPKLLLKLVLMLKGKYFCLNFNLIATKRVHDLDKNKHVFV